MKIRGIFTASVMMFILHFYAQGQSVGISNVAITPDASSILEVRATNKGLLIPRVSLTSTTDAATIALPATSLLVYNLSTVGAGATAVTPGYYYNAGIPAAPDWQRVATSKSAWLLTGNYGTDPVINWLGTNDNQHLAIRTNNVERIRILNTGYVGINTATPTQYLHVNGNSLVNDAMYVTSIVSGVVRYGNVGVFGQTTAFGPDGANSGVWIEGSNAESGGFFANGDNAVIWSPGDNDILRVFDEDVLPAGNPCFVIDGGGEVGINITAPDDRLDVGGNAQVSGYLRVGNPTTPSTVPSNTPSELYQWNNQNGLFALLGGTSCGSGYWSYLISGLNSYYLWQNVGSRSYSPLQTPFMWVPTSSTGVRIELNFDNSLEGGYDGIYLEYSTDGVTWNFFNNWAFQGYNDATVSGSNNTCAAGWGGPAWTNTGQYGPLSNTLAVNGQWVRFRLVGVEDGSNSGGDFRLYGLTVWINSVGSVGGAFATGNIYAQNNVYAGSNVLMGDVAEYFDVEGYSEPGYLVSINPEKPDAYWVTRKAYDNHVIGIRSTAPTVTINDPNSGVAVALTGRVPVFVCNENGPVRPGDFLTASSKPGYAMKADKACYVIGQALDFMTEDEAKILCLVKSAWYAPDGAGSLSSGDFFVPEGVSEVTINDPAIQPQSKIFLTMLGDAGQRFWISKKEQGSFTIAFSGDVAVQTPFDYLVENAVEGVSESQFNSNNEYVSVVKPADFESGSWKYDETKEIYWRTDPEIIEGNAIPVMPDDQLTLPPVPDDPTQGYVWYGGKMIKTVSVEEPETAPEKSELDLLLEKKQRGEISPEEYEAAKRALGY